MGIIGIFVHVGTPVGVGIAGVLAYEKMLKETFYIKVLKVGFIIASVNFIHGISKDIEIVFGISVFLWSDVV